ncbi:MAG: AraC family transcriptional regulator [Firmicutes bacterium]|nr:AraC family transcriptional regulator [Bacillota bacterium]
MDWITGMQRAIDYIEDHLTEEINYEEVAGTAFSSSYHFQRLFSLLSGYTLGEYIRMRRLTLAGHDLVYGHKVLETALKYGYDSPESFSKAFKNFHGITPSMARTKEAKLNSFSKLSISIQLIGGNQMNYQIIKKPAMTLVGFKRHFTGVPYGEEREKQEEKLFVTTRGIQWFLCGTADDHDSNEYCVITNVDDEGYDFYFSKNLHPWTRDHLYDHSTTGVDFIESLNLETIEIPETTYLIVEARKDQEKGTNVVSVYFDLRKRIATELVSEESLRIVPGPELAVYHWNPRETRNIQIWIPVEES